MSSSPRAPVVVADSVTQLTRSCRGSVLIAGSHGGTYSAYLAARANVLGVILNDAGIGRESAGIDCLSYFENLGLPAATVSNNSSRIGDGSHMVTHGIISHVNSVAHALGCRQGESVAKCAECMRHASNMSHQPVPAYGKARFLFRRHRRKTRVWGIDSISLVRPGDSGDILVAGSHGALIGAKLPSLPSPKPIGIILNDAGVGIDSVGVSSLPVLDESGIPAATVSAATARIGDARSSWNSGILSHVNSLARSYDAAPGDMCREFVALLIRSIHSN